MPLTIAIDMTESNMEHPTAGRRRRHKSPPIIITIMHAAVALPVPRLDDHIDTEIGPSDEEGEKEAKRQRSEPTTPISTASRLPYEYDQVMGITQAASGEAEGLEEGLDLEYHDAAEDPNVLEPEEQLREPVLSHGGCGSSSLRECIELMSNSERKAPATCHSGPKMENRSGPPQKRGVLKIPKFSPPKSTANPLAMFSGFKPPPRGQTYGVRICPPTWGVQWTPGRIPHL